MSNRRGVLLFVMLLVLCGGLAIYAAWQSRRPVAAGGGATVLVFDVPTRLDESVPPFRAYSLDALSWRPRPTVADVVEGLQLAANDDQVKALVLHVDGIDWGWGKLLEVRNAIQSVRDSGKPVYASVRSGGDAEYLLASVADRVSAPHAASLYIDGLTMSALFLRGAFDKLGVTPNFAHVGEFKSAVESYTRKDMSAPAREALDAVLEGDFRTLVDSVSTARGLAADTVRALIDRGPFTAPEALAVGLLDTLLDDAELDSMAVRKARGRPTTLSFTRYLDRELDDHTGSRVALVVAEGGIVRGRGGRGAGDGGAIGSESLIATLRDVRTRKSVKAVVLRVNSPGGDSQASDEIWREVERLRRVKPVVVSMSDYAASGGYYISMGADAIVAQPGTLTGSIGIYGGKFNIKGLLDKLGLGIESVSRGAHAQMLSPYRDFTPEEGAIYQRHLEEFYRGFVEHAAEGRKLEVATMDSLGRGRVWSGADARARGLVDELGGLPRAVALAREKAGLTADGTLSVERYPRREQTFLQQLIESLNDDDTSDEAALAWLVPGGVRWWVALATLPAGRALAILPYSIEIR